MFPMNLSSIASIDQLKDMISHCDDDRTSHIVWVDVAGEVHVTPMPVEATPAVWAEGNRELIRFRFETLKQGSGFVGPEAAKDEQWMNRLFVSLTKFWESGAKGYRDHL